MLPPPQQPELADAGDRPLSDVVQPFESEIEIGDQQFDELQRWHGQMLKDMNEPAPGFKRAAQAYQQHRHRSRLRQDRTEKVDWDAPPLALEAPPPPPAPDAPGRQIPTHASPPRATAGARRAAEWTPSALSPENRPRSDKNRRTGGGTRIFRLGGAAEPELHADDLHDAVVASAEAHSPFG